MFQFDQFTVRSRRVLTNETVRYCQLLLDLDYPPIVTFSSSIGRFVTLSIVIGVRLVLFSSLEKDEKIFCIVFQILNFKFRFDHGATFCCKLLVLYE